jgi:ribosomal-protein-alanine N-acetyltransferase
MRTGDIDKVYEIEAASFSDPWLKEFFVMELEHDAYVAEQDSIVVGYVCAWQVLDECTITNISVQPELRRKGIGKFMLENLFRIMHKRDVINYYLEVRASNLPAQNLYNKLGFRQVGIRKSYYHNPPEDAVVMAWDTMPS